MAYAIIKTGGKQFRVEEGKTVRVPSINKPAGEAVELDVMMLAGDDGTKVGSTLEASARVAATSSSSSKRSAASSTSARRDTGRITRRSRLIQLSDECRVESDE